ncbi:MAG: hypothetical protein KF689_02150 [Gemmatimonadaceae bacterium]|nr:hypothetical protein [Gemmatimonadaceae bacterium]MCW5826737.1 hypothetical protein [Gemmatimonadaceae bacterium]
MRQTAGFVAVAALLVLGGAWGLAALKPELARAFWVSAGIAMLVQVLAFSVARPFVRTNPIAGWGLGALLRFAAVGIHAVVGAKALGLPFGPALMSLVGFLFVTMLVEPFFLK